MPRTLAGIAFAIVLVLAGAGVYHVSHAAPKGLDELGKLRIVSAYKDAVEEQAKFQAVVAAYNDVAQREITRAGLPKGTQFEVNLATKDVFIHTPPPPTPPAKPAVKK